MAGAPETRYARDGDAHIAYQIASEMGGDLLFVPTATFPIDLIWDEPIAARSLRRLGSFSRLILCDLLGVGSSDPVPITNLPAMQAWTDGIGAVLDAAGSDRAAIFASGESTPPAMMFAASHPERVSALVLWSPYANFLRDPEQPFGIPEATLEKYIEVYRETMGTGAVADLLAPSSANEPGFRAWWARGERLSAGPGYFSRILDLFLRTDVRAVLPAIQTPTLVLRRRDDRHIRTGHSQLVADLIPGARLVELPGEDSTWFAGDTNDLLDEVESFLTGERTSTATNRVLSTVLFTDIVGSTERAAAVGDAAWISTLDAHDAIVERHVGSFRGRVVQFTGDGVLATFDGPARAIHCATAISVAVRDHLDLDIRCGLHTGEVEMFGDEMRGIAVHIAARIMALAGAGEVLVSGSVPPLVLGSGIGFTDRGMHVLKGVPDEWPVFAVVASTDRLVDQQANRATGPRSEMW